MIDQVTTGATQIVTVWFKSGANYCFTGYMEKKGNMIWVRGRDKTTLINYSAIDFIDIRDV